MTDFSCRPNFKSLKMITDTTVSGFTMLDTPVPNRTLKLSNIGPGYYLDGRPFGEFQVLLAPIPLPLRTEYSLFRLSLSQSSDWDLLKPKKNKTKKTDTISTDRKFSIVIVSFADLTTDTLEL